MAEIKVGSELEENCIVEESMLACQVGSGRVNVYATPMLIAFMEQVAANLLQPFLEEGLTSVGTFVSMTHDSATPCGMQVRVKAKISHVNKRKVSFEIEAFDEACCIGKATHERYIVEQKSFQEKAYEKLKHKNK